MQKHPVRTLTLVMLMTCRVHAGDAPVLAAAPAPPPAPLPHARIAQLYRRHCASCHGEKGDGNGPAAHFLTPRPRDFAEGDFKLRSTAPGDIPTQEDLERTVRRGVPGTPMPAFGRSLSDAEVQAVIAVLKSFSSRFEADGAGMPLELPAPPPRRPDTLALGRLAYEKLGCARCHGDNGRGDGPEATGLIDATCYPAHPRDLTLRARYKGGATARDIYRTLATGLDGTPMMALRTGVSDADRWNLAYYVSSLAR